MTGHEVELDIAHEHAGRQVSALLSAALTAAQSAAQIAADRVRQREVAAETQARAAQRVTDQQTRAEQQAQRQAQQTEALAQRQAERQARTEETLRHKQWGLKPDAEWLADNPLSAASAWAGADTHRHSDPIAARHAQLWEAVFAKAGIDLDEVRTNATAATADNTADETVVATEAAEAAGDLAAVEVAVGAAATGAADLAGQLAHEEKLQRISDRFHAAPDLEGQIAAARHYALQMTTELPAGWSEHHSFPDLEQAALQRLQATTPSTNPAVAQSLEPPLVQATSATAQPPAAESSTTATTTIDPASFSAYAGGDPIAILGGRGFSKPASQILADAKTQPDVASLEAAANMRSVQAEPVAVGVER